MPCSGCSGGTSIGYIGLGGRVRVSLPSISNPAPGGNSIQFSYSNGDASPRVLAVDVNGIFSRNLTFPTSGNGQSVKHLVFQAVLTPGLGNLVEFYNPNGYGPDLDYFKIEI